MLNGKITLSNILSSCFIQLSIYSRVHTAIETKNSRTFKDRNYDFSSTKIDSMQYKLYQKNQCDKSYENRQCRDTSDPGHFSTGPKCQVSVRHFGTSAELSRHIGTSAEVSYGHFGTKEDISTARHQATLDQATTRWTAVLA